MVSIIFSYDTSSIISKALLEVQKTVHTAKGNQNETDGKKIAEGQTFCDLLGGKILGTIDFLKNSRFPCSGKIKSLELN